MPSSWAETSARRTRYCRNDADSEAPGVETGGIDHQTAADQLVDHGANIQLGELQHGLAVALLVAGVDQRIERERVLIRRADLSLSGSRSRAPLMGLSTISMSYSLAKQDVKTVILAKTLRASSTRKSVLRADAPLVQPCSSSCLDVAYCRLVDPGIRSVVRMRTLSLLLNVSAGS